MKFLIVVDMQNDFISGALGRKHAEAIVPNIVEKVGNYDGTIIFTRDTHFADYLSTQEGDFPLSIASKTQAVGKFATN